MPQVSVHDIIRTEFKAQKVPMNNAQTLSYVRCYIGMFIGISAKFVVLKNTNIIIKGQKSRPIVSLRAKTYFVNWSSKKDNHQPIFSGKNS